MKGQEDTAVEGGPNPVPIIVDVVEIVICEKPAGAK